ncbi:hypothetical protein G3M48_002149 [Beauveria asiatica]|uniref:Hydrophobin n=1 Tax=Beauveria asiatica TaxID=1069075 RepID=A0AAW0S7U6_9HYPO
MFSRLFTVPAMFLAALGSATASPPGDESACRPLCCKALVQSALYELVGIDCDNGGVDCSFSGKVFACCAALVPIGAQRGTGVQCKPGN